MRKLTTLLLLVFMTFGCVGNAGAFEPVDNLINSGKMSNDDVYTIYVDMLNSPQGSVVSTVYETNAEIATSLTHTVLSQSYSGTNGAKDKLSRFFLYLGNNNQDMIMGLKGATPDELVAGYVYGPRKTEIINSYVSGIVDCLGNPALWTSSGSDGDSGSNSTTSSPKSVTTPINPDSWAEKYITTTFTLDSATYTMLSPDTTTPTMQTMDVKPYVKDNRTYVPVRFLAYSLGVQESGVKWDRETQQVTLSKGDNKVSMVIGTPTMYVNNQPVIMDVVPEIKNNRTMLPARWVAEALGATVEWDDKAKEAIVKIPETEPGN